ncbi:MAG: sulfotransferase domain-containing protein [bacterium]
MTDLTRISTSTFWLFCRTIKKDKLIMKQNINKEVITIVSGLPRSGTSMLMKMLEAGGMKILTDQIRTADEDNPKGYYEFEKVKELEKDTSWLQNAKGKAVKVISALLEHLPQNYSYKIIFIHRKIEEILASQKQMLIRRGQPTDKVSDEEMKKIFLKHVQQVEDWLANQSNIDVMYLYYNEILKEPVKYSARINQFLGDILNTKNMAGIVDKTLHRQRR